MGLFGLRQTVRSASVRDQRKRPTWSANHVAARDQLRLRRELRPPDSIRGRAVASRNRPLGEIFVEARTGSSIDFLVLDPKFGALDYSRAAVALASGENASVCRYNP